MTKLLPANLAAAQRIYDNGLSWEECAAGARILQAHIKRIWTSEQVPVKSFSVTPRADIPPLAWLCEINGANYALNVGSGVEYGSRHIVEGAWPGKYEDLDFGASDHFYGTGAFLDKNDVCVFTPPRHCVDYLYALRDDDRGISYVSNSFCFIFQRMGLDLHGSFFQAFKRALNPTTNRASGVGADRGSPIIARDGHFSIYRLMYHNFSLDNDGRPNYLPRLPAKLNIHNFDDYANFLRQTTTALIANGASPVRKNPRQPVTMLSTGYDSTAVSSVCAQCGVREAVTLNVVIGKHNDCGADIAKKLGLVCHSAASPLGARVPTLTARLENLGEPFLEFFATAGIGDNMAFMEMEKFIRDKMVFSGLYGDGCWSREGNGAGLAHHLPYMKSRNEFRLRSAYWLVPMPAFGAYFPYVLKRAARSPGMEKFSVHGNYDRPIARRLAEEAGVPREMFGQAKAANNPRILNWWAFFDAAVRSVMCRYA